MKRNDADIAMERMSLERDRAELSKRIAQLDDELIARAKPRIDALRAERNRPHATIGWSDSGYVIDLGFTQTEHWDDKALADAILALPHANLNDRVTYTYSIPDMVYQSLAPKDRVLLDRARRVSYGVESVRVSKVSV